MGTTPDQDRPSESSPQRASRSADTHFRKVPGEPGGRDAIGRWRRRVLQPWRWALAGYGISLTIATHWPRLQLSPEVPTSDKMIHALAFGALTLLLWRSGVFAGRSAVGGRDAGWSAWFLTAAAAAAWAALDEISQGLPGIYRVVSWHDLLANMCGVVCAMALIWAMRPTQPSDQLAAPNRARSRLLEFTFNEMFATWRPWLIGAAMLGGCALAVMLARPMLPSPQGVGVFGLVVAIVAAHALYLIYRWLFFARFARVLIDRPCLACGAGDESRHRDVCPDCGTDCSDQEYSVPPRPRLRAVLSASIAPALTAIVGVGALFAVVLVVPRIYEWALTAPGVGGRSSLPRLAQTIGRLPRELDSVIDLTIYVLLIALVVRMWRRRMAAYIDRAFRCRKCGHDLHGTPVDQHGQGHCGECAAPFARHLAQAAPRAAEQAERNPA